MLLDPTILPRRSVASASMTRRNTRMSRTSAQSLPWCNLLMPWLRIQPTGPQLSQRRVLRSSYETATHRIERTSSWDPVQHNKLSVLPSCPMSDRQTGVMPRHSYRPEERLGECLREGVDRSGRSCPFAKRQQADRSILSTASRTGRNMPTP